MKTLFVKNLISKIALGLAVVTTGFFVSCSNEEFEHTEDTSTDLSDYYTYLINSGFEKDEITYDAESDYFIIHEDLLISREEVGNYIKRDGLDAGAYDKQRRGTYIISPERARNVTYFIEGDVNADWRRAITDAVAQYNAISNSNLRISITNNRNNADARIFNGFSNQNWVARALLPNSSRRVGSWIEINTKFNGMAAGRKLFTMVHEMGHNFGLLHTNQSQGAVIPGTPIQDPRSVMNSSVLDWNGFTNFDVVAIRALYPGNGGGGGGGDDIVTIYRDCPYTGSSQTLGVGNFNLRALQDKGMVDNTLSSFRVKSGYRIFIYTGSNFNGSAGYTSRDIECLDRYGWNDVVSSIRVVKL